MKASALLCQYIIPEEEAASTVPETALNSLLFHTHQEALRMVSSAYLRLVVFLLAILIPACASSSPPFSMMYSVYKLNKQSDNIQPYHTPFPILNQYVVPYPVLTVAS